MKIVKKISLIIIGVILSLILLEIGLQLAGFTLITIKKYRNKTAKDPNIITVLCLGESTTDGQWPPILQKILNEKSKNKKFNVVDEGMSGINTKIIAEKISDILLKHNPDIVVLMMGINDNGLEYENYGIKVLALISLIETHCKHLFTSSISYDEIEYIDRKMFEIISKNNADTEKYLYKIKKISEDTNYNFSNFIKYFICYARNNKYQNSKIINIIDYNIINKKIITPWELEEIIYYLKDYKNYNENKIKDFLVSAKDRLSYEDVSLERILMMYDLQYLLNDIKNNEFNFEYKNIKESKKSNKDNTKENYQYIISTIYRNNKNTIIMPMQYPVLSIEELKEKLKASPYYDKLIFISNEENFKTALQNHKTEEIFTDMFGGKFGHCTELGNTLIAENVAETILKLYN